MKVPDLVQFDDPFGRQAIPTSNTSPTWLPELVHNHLDLGRAPGRANTGDKMMTLVASAPAGGDCIDDADVLRAGGTVGVLGCVVKAPSTLGTFLRSFRWGHVRQLDRVSRQLSARAWAAGAGPGDSPLPALNRRDRVFNVKWTQDCCAGTRSASTALPTTRSGDSGLRQLPVRPTHVPLEVPLDMGIAKVEAPREAVAIPSY